MNKIALTLIFGLATGFAVDAFAVTKKKFDFVVGVDGDFKAAVAAAAAANPSESNRFVIFFPDGEYDITKLTGDDNGKSTFPTSYVSFVGQSQDNTVISNTTTTEGISVTATLYFPNNNGMYMQDLTVKNKSTYATSSAARQVTIQHKGNKYIFKNVRLLSGQDTYYTNGSGRVYWEGGEIQGTVDFICGDGDVWFEGTNLVMTRNGGYITAAKTSTEWGYVFNNAKINVSNSSFNGTFYLGRSWGHAKTVFLNTTMYAQPTAAGWGPDMNAGPDVFAEYNSKNGNGGAINTSQRKTYFDGGKDASTAKTLKTVWSASDAAKYTLANVIGGSDGWEPNKLTVQMAAPKIAQEGSEITWANDENALCWAVFVNGKFKTSVATNKFDLGDVAIGSKITVRAANSMGGLGATSNEVEVLESNVTYYKVILNSSIGGTIESNLTSTKAAEGKEITFTAKPIDGWTFAGWTGASAPMTDDVSGTLKITASSDIELKATFSAKGKNTFQAESGILENAINESTNAGFAGDGYVNFGAGNSYVNVPVYADAAGTYKMEMTYSNGSSSDRDLIVNAIGDGNTAASSAEASQATSQQITFEKTADWKTYSSKEVEIDLPRGASYIQFTVVGSDDGPNLDQIVLTPLNVEEIPEETSSASGDVAASSESGNKDGSDGTDVAASSSSATTPANGEQTTIASWDKLEFNAQFSSATIHVFSLQGKLVRTLHNQKGISIAELRQMLQREIPAGTYLIRATLGQHSSQKIIQIR